MKQLGGFKANQYQPEAWAKLIQESGAKYSVITTRHHDGVSLWDSKSNNAITTAKDAAAKKDVLTPFVTALQKKVLKPVYITPYQIGVILTMMSIRE